MSDQTICDDSAPDNHAARCAASPAANCGARKMLLSAAVSEP